MDFVKKKKGNILTENIIFIILNLVFITILLVFLFSKTSSSAVLEEKYAKEIALLIDSAEEGMFITIDMEDAVNEARKNNIEFSDIVSIQDNIVTVTLNDGEGYSYSFFNAIEAENLNSYSNEDKTGFVFVIG